MALPQLEMLADLVDANAGALGIRRCFLNHTPDEELEAVMLRVPLVGAPIDHYLPGVFKHDFQAIVRSASQAVGAPRADALLSLLTLRSRTLATGGVEMDVHHLLPRTQPIAYERSPANLYEWSINLRAHYWLSGFQGQEGP